MSKIINLYLDETGNNHSEFFSVGGFYLIDSSLENIFMFKRKIAANIKVTEKSIKLYRAKNEENLPQLIDFTGRGEDEEVKWHLLSPNNKHFLFQQLRNFSQYNVSITSNLKKWQPKNDNSINLDAIYNMMVYFLVNNILLKNHLDSLPIDEEIIIDICIDQRKAIPKVSSKIGSTVQTKKIDSLEKYLNDKLLKDNRFNNLKVSVKQLVSKQEPLIRYADFYVGLIGAMCRTINKTSGWYDENTIDDFKLMHRTISCNCYSTIRNQSLVINEICKLCGELNPPTMVRNDELDIDTTLSS